MRVSPVVKHKSPDYPTKHITDVHPELLCIVPERWKGNTTVLAALAGASMLLSGCRAGSGGATAQVAPIFFHGDGRGSTGCQSVNPPIYLSEEEAHDVIAQEAKKAGISFTRGTTLNDVIMPPPAGFMTKNAYRNEPSPVELDGTNVKRNISFEFVSVSDTISWEKLPVSTARNLSPRDAAAVLRSQLAKSNSNSNSTYAVFYEPYTEPKYTDHEHWREDMDGAQSAAMEIDKEKLRKQVQDFIKWLKAEGVI